MKAIIFCIVALCATSNAFFGSKKEHPHWDKLTVKFGIPLKDPGFYGFPMNEKEAVKMKFMMNEDACATPNFYVGKRYALAGDTSAMVLFDANGQVAGMQMKFPAGHVLPKSWKGSPFIEENGNYYLTAYFIDPHRICDPTHKRDEHLLGNQVSIQMTSALMSSGHSPMRVMTLPLRETDIAKTKWTKGKCFWGMGQHYWYNVSKKMNCDDFFPVFLLYNYGLLNGFGWATSGYLESDYVEHPPADKLHMFFKEVPECLSAPGTQRTTQHIYLDKRPYFNHC